MLRCLPLWKACNQQVDYVDKRHCNLLAVPDDVLRYTHTLEELLLDANQISELPRGFFRLLQLRKLTLSDNEISRLPPDIANFMHLQELDISRNDIEDIPDNIKYCKHLQVADFSSNPLQRLPDGFTHLRNLTHLGLNDVSLTRLPTDIGSLSNLESLELRENLIKYLPASISFLVRLRILDLGSNMIDELPEFIGSLNSLEELWLDCNEIVELPLEIGNLRNLTQLDVSENKLEQLPDEIGGLIRLTDLILSQNQLEYLPESIGNLKRLTIMKCDQNRLLQLTLCIGNCESLQELLLTENLLTELPATLGRLKLLTIFNVDRNQLMEIPREIGSCTRMGVLSLRDNRILRLPSELGNLKDLHVLDVCGNRLQYLPLNLSSCNLKAIWLSENQVQPLLKFQQDVDESSGLKVLTCFLLPQQAYQGEGVDNLLKDGTGTIIGQENWAKDSTVKFAGDEGDPLAIEESHFVRHNTPHPKELRARHGKLTKKDAIDIFALSQNSGEEHMDESLSDREVCCSTESHSSKSSDVSAGSKASTVKVPSDQMTPVDDRLLSNSYKAVPQFLKPEVLSQTNIFGMQTIEELSDVKETPGTEEAGDDKELDSAANEKQVRNAVEKHVEFSCEEDDIDDKESRLHRRDTPHHLKNKHVNTAANNDVDSERVQHILSRQLGTCESFESWVELPEPVEVDGDCIEVQNAGELPPPPSVEELTLTSVTSAGTNKQTPKIDIPEKIMEVWVNREAGVPLGMSIAGGVGLAPFGRTEGVFLSRVATGGPSDEAGLRPGDRLISVNGTDINNMDHSSVVTMLKEAGQNVCLIIARQAIEEMKELHETLTVKLCRDENGLGFTIAGGRGSTPYKGNDQSIYISRISKGGAADHEGSLHVGDRLISVNGIDVSAAQHDEAVMLLTGIVGPILLIVTRASNQMSPELSAKIAASADMDAGRLTSPSHETYVSPSLNKPSSFHTELPTTGFDLNEPDSSGFAADADNESVPLLASSRTNNMPQCSTYLPFSNQTSKTSHADSQSQNVDFCRTFLSSGLKFSNDFQSIPSSWLSGNAVEADSSDDSRLCSVRQVIQSGIVRTLQPL